MNGIDVRKQISKQEEQMLRRLTLKCKIEKKECVNSLFECTEQ